MQTDNQLDQQPVNNSTETVSSEIPGQTPTLAQGTIPASSTAGVTPITADAPPQTPPLPENRKKFALIALIAFLGLLVVGGGIWFLVSGDSKQESLSVDQLADERAQDEETNNNLPTPSEEQLAAYIQSLAGLSPGETYLRIIQLQKEAKNLDEYFSVTTSYSGPEYAETIEWIKSMYQAAYESKSDDWLHD